MSVGLWGGAGAAMSAFNYIGMEWGGSHLDRSNTTILRRGSFPGMVLTIMKYRAVTGWRRYWFADALAVTEA